ncbi:hypothetical protein LCGC14_1546890, partial [marine sediment metagenome]
NSVPGISFPNKRLSYTIQPKTAQGIIGKYFDIILTPKENNIFEFLRQVKKDMNLNVQMRVAGGWVRDKLLGKESDDIDIAVDMPGYDLARIISEAAVRYNINHVDRAYRVSLEKSNTSTGSQSDDLMVGAVNLFGQKIEFVPMRTEHYPDPNSRTPQITTTSDPKEDVKRRDLTINALYYNVDTGQIEDFVGGREDLGLGGGQIRLKTPDEAYKTFEEDPLRLLRVLRFYSRYPNSVVDPSIVEAMKDPNIHKSYKRKVASERAGPEIMKMMMGEDPVKSLSLLFDSNLYKTVFNVPAMENIHADGIHMDQQSPHHEFDLMNHTLEVVSNLNNIMKENGQDDHLRGIANISAMFHDFGKMAEDIQQPHETKDHMTYHGHEDASLKIVKQILKRMSLPEDDKNMIEKIVELHMASMGDQKMKISRLIARSRRKGGEENYPGYKDVWKILEWHNQADAMSSRPDNYNPLEYQERFNQVQDYVDSFKEKGPSSVLNGNDLMQMFPKLEPKTGFIPAFQDILAHELDIQNRGDLAGSTELKQQAANALNNYLVANPLVLQQFQGDRMAKNWFKRIKKSQVLPGIGGDKEVSSIDYKEEGIVTGLKPAKCPYSNGMKIRDRRKGLAVPQEYGRIVNVDNDEITIQWYDSENKAKNKQKIKTDDTVALSAIVAEG